MALYKVLSGRSGRDAQNGGTYRYVEGEWTTPVDVNPCYSGYHLTNAKSIYNWIKPGSTVWVAEGKGQKVEEDTKIVFSQARITRSLGKVSKEDLLSSLNNALSSIDEGKFGEIFYFLSVFRTTSGDPDVAGIRRDAKNALNILGDIHRNVNLSGIRTLIRLERAFVCIEHALILLSKPDVSFESLRLSLDDLSEKWGEMGTRGKPDHLVAFLRERADDRDSSIWV